MRLQKLRLEDCFLSRSSGGVFSDIIMSTYDIPYEDITLQKIDYQWIGQCTKVKHLRKAVKLIQQDGDYFIDLKNACQNRLEVLDPTIAMRRVSNNVSQEQRKKAMDDIFDWEEGLKKKERKDIFEKECEPVDQQEHNAYLRQQTRKDQQWRLKTSQSFRLKGNQALRSGDLNQALQYYSKSIDLDSKSAASYCNRSLIYLKKKDYQEAVSDATAALKYDSKYLKAYLRRGKAYQHLNRLRDSAADFRKALQIDKDCKQALNELSDVLHEMQKLGLKQQVKFTRLEIKEQEEDLSDIQ